MSTIRSSDAQASPTPVRSAAIVGTEGAGKTVMLTMLANKLADTKSSTYLECLNRQANRFKNENWEILQNQDWPAGTPEGRHFDLQFCLHSAQGATYPLRALDFSGQNFRKLFANEQIREHIEELPENLRSLADYLQSAHIVIVLVNLTDFMDPPDAGTRSDNEWALKFCLDYLKSQRRRVCIVLSQADRYRSTIASLGGAVGVVEKYLKELYNAHINDDHVQVFCVAAVADKVKVARPGEPVREVPAPGFSSEGLDELVNWISQSADALQQEDVREREQHEQERIRAKKERELAAATARAKKQSEAVTRVVLGVIGAIAALLFLIWIWPKGPEVLITRTEGIGRSVTRFSAMVENRSGSDKIVTVRLFYNSPIDGDMVSDKTLSVGAHSNGEFVFDDFTFSKLGNDIRIIEIRWQSPLSPVATMLTLLALYDPATGTPQGDYWAWRHPGIPSALPETLFNNLAASREPTTPIGSEAAEIGFASIDTNWCAWYRFYFGGEIRRKRHILACAFIRRSDLQPSATLGPWEAYPLAELAEKAIRHCPLPPPNTLEAEWSPPLAHPNATLLAKWKRGGDWVYEGLDYAQQTLAACSLLPQSQAFHCRISQRANSTRVALTIRNETATEQIPPAPKPPNQPPSKPPAPFPQPRPQPLPRGVIPPAKPVYHSIWPVILRNHAVWALLLVLLATSAGYVAGRRSTAQSPYRTPPTFPTSAPDLDFLQSLLDTADRLATVPGVKSPRKFTTKIEDIRFELKKPGVTPSQVTKYRNEIAGMLDDLAGAAAAVQAATLPAVRSTNATDH